MEIQVINLARSRDRRARVEQVLRDASLAFEFFEAVDGQAGDHPLFARHDPRLAETRYGFQLAPGELGCYASHYLLWEKCVHQQQSILVMEDDIELSKGFRDSYEQAAGKIETYGLLRLSAHKNRKFSVVEKLDQTSSVVQFAQNPSGTSCYAIAPWAAKRFLTHAQVWFEPVDCLLDRYWDHGVGCYAIHPYTATHVAQTNEQSEIWQGTARGPRSNRSRRFPVARRFYRLKDNLKRKLYKLRYGLKTG